MISKGFYETLEIIAGERNLAIQDVLDKVAVALKKACATEGYTGEIQVEFNEERKRIQAFDYSNQPPESHTIRSRQQAS